MIAVLFGTFNAKHAASALLAGDLRRAGVELRSCHEALWEETRDKHASYFAPGALLGLAFRWAAAMARLAWRFRRVAVGADLLVAGFNGQLDVLLARRLARGRRVLFAPLVTITETLVDDRRRYTRGSLLGRLLAWIDRRSLGAADLVVVDTEAHGAYVRERFGIPRSRILVQYLGAEDLFAPAETDPPPLSGVLRVLGYGSYLPLHGYDVVAAAAALISADEGIVFDLIGSGPERESCERSMRGLSHVRLHDWAAYEELPQWIRNADVVLGIFGSSVKANMVIPNKVYQAAQVGRTIVTADTTAIREVFSPGQSIVAVAPEPEALAGALRSLAADPERRRKLGAAAREAALRSAGPDVRAGRLRAVLDAPGGA